MKGTTKLFSLLMIAVLICGCKQENWLDWKLQNELWLINNAKQAGVVTTPTGLQYKCIEAGWDKSARPDEAKVVVIDYEGKMINDYVFDSATAYESNVSSFVAGFAEGLKKIYVKQGDKVTAKQAIGEIVTNTAEDNKTELYFQIYQDRTILNPGLWLAQ